MSSLKQIEKAFKGIFPKGEINLFLHYYKFWRDVDLALWSYGEIRQNEYLREKTILRELIKNRRL